jgi:transposase
MNKQRKQYEAAFKLEVARMVVDQSVSIAQVVKDMNIGRTAAYRWIEQYRAEQQGKTGIGKPLPAELQRIRQLENQNRQLKSDCALLKKASTLFAHEMK